MKILFISDIHGNIEALNTILEEVKEYDEIVVLGDLVDYGPDPDLVIDTVKSLTTKIIRGNHDEAVAFNTDCKCGLELHELSVYTRRHISYTKLSSNDILYLRNLPLYLELDVSGYKILAVHGNMESPLYGYTYPWLRNEELCRLLRPRRSRYFISTSECSELDYDYVFIGHTHISFLRPLFNSKVINPGSAGQPRDGDPRASITIVDFDKGIIEFRRLKYNVDKTINKLRDLIQDNTMFEFIEKILREGKIGSHKLI